MKLCRMQAFAVYENRPCRSQLNGCEQDDKSAYRHQPEARCESRVSGACCCPKERDETVVIPRLDVADQKDRCPNDCRRHHPSASAIQGFLKSEAEERQHADRVQIEDALGERDDITREGEGKPGKQGPCAPGLPSPSRVMSSRSPRASSICTRSACCRSSASLLRKP